MNKSGNHNFVIYDNYYLIYGIRIQSELYYDMIDFVVESGEYEGELMEFIGDEWDFFDVEGRSKPDRYEWLEGFLEQEFGFNSIYNARGEDVLYIGKIVWSSNNIDVQNCVGYQDPRFDTLTSTEENNVKMQVNDIKRKLKVKNEYWSDNLLDASYYWIRGTT